MSTQKTTWILELIDKITSPMKGVADSSENAENKVEKLGKSLKSVSAMDLRAISESVGDVARVLNEMSEPGIKYDSAMKEVEAITGVTGKALDELGGRARVTAKVFGGEASEMLESYKGVLSRLGPDIAKNQVALDQMGVNIATLSKAMENDAVGAMDALTTSALQFGVDLSDPQHAADEMTRMMNVMAAGAKEGASEVTQISAALKQAGVQALNSNVSFEATNAALQALAQGGKYGSDSGVALRNVLGKMAGIDVIPKEAATKLTALGVNYDIVADKTLPFTDRLRELGKAQGDATIMAQIFGTENAAAAQILLRSVDYQDELTQKITGTNTAVEQADVIMGSYSEKIARTKAWFSDLGISVFGVTQHILPFVDGLAGSVMVMANLTNAGKGVMMLMNTIKLTTVATAIWNAVLAVNPIVWVVAGVAALIAGLVLAYKHIGAFRGAIMGTWEAIKGFGLLIKDYVVDRIQGILSGLGGLAKAIGQLFKGDFKAAMATAKNAGADLVGITAGKNAIDNAKAVGRNVGEAYNKGISEVGTKKNTSALSSNPSKPTPTNLNKSGVSSVITPVNLSTNSANGKASGLSGSGSGIGGGTKTINQKIEVKNYFTVSEGSNVEAIAEKVVRVINDRLRDATVALS